jgi:hypothetical protein
MLIEGQKTTDVSKAELGNLREKLESNKQVFFAAETKYIKIFNTFYVLAFVSSILGVVILLNEHINSLFTSISLLLASVLLFIAINLLTKINAIRTSLIKMNTLDNDIFCLIQFKFKNGLDVIQIPDEFIYCIEHISKKTVFEAILHSPKIDLSYKE